MLNDSTNLKYRRCVEQLYLKCQEVQNENERFIHRINKVKKMIKRRTKDVALLKGRLDKYHDGWRMVPMVAPHRTRKTELKKGAKPKTKGNETRGRPAGSKKRNSEKVQLKQKLANTANNKFPE